MDLLVSEMPKSIERFLRWGLLASAALVASLCCLLVFRRFGGALDQPLSSGVLAVVTAIALVMGAGFRVGWLVLTRAEESTRSMVWLAIPSICLALLATALTLPSTPLWTLTLFWGAIVGTEAAWWIMGTHRRVTGRSAIETTPTAGATDPGGHAVSQVDDEGPLLPDGVTQQLIRSGDEANGESLSGLARTTFAPGELVQQVHIAFCPPFVDRPQLEAYVVDGPEATLKVAQLESFGTRLELRLPPRPQEMQQVVVGFEASCGPKGDGGCSG